MQECDIDQKKMVYLLEETGLWGEAVRQRRAVITNDYATCPEKRGLPTGHVKVLRHMNVPIMDKGKIVIVAGVGNKEDEYNDADVRQLTLLMGGMWKLIQRRRAEEELHRRDLLLQGVARATIYLLTPDPNAVQKTLGILGEAADVDRVQILENPDTSHRGKIACRACPCSGSESLQSHSRETSPAMTYSWSGRIHSLATIASRA